MSLAMTRNPRHQPQIALFELAQRENAPDPGPRRHLLSAQPVIGPCKLCEGKSAPLPDLAGACVLCRTGRPKEPTCGRCRVLIAQVQETFEGFARAAESRSR